MVMSSMDFCHSMPPSEALTDIRVKGQMVGRNQDLHLTG